MFTGLIQSLGRLRASEPRDGDVRLVFGAGALAMNEVQLGESIAVSGVCLTVVAFDTCGFAADVSLESLQRSTLGSLEIGAPVNLERALRVGDRLGGHLVSGHVDGVGSVQSIETDARSQRWRFQAPTALMRYIAEKGSICVDGVSLTINAVGPDWFEVNLVPHTIEHTAFSETLVGAQVNLEVDQVARYVESLLAARDPSAPSRL
jgi:riboflavin synthase